VLRVVPDYWSLALSLGYLAMIVIGGLGSVGGAVLGAAFVAVLPAVFQRYGDAIPGVGTAGGGGLGPAVVAQLIYGAVVVLVLIFEPRGLISLLRRLGGALRRLVPLNSSAGRPPVGG
jgi:branched-chain amino acid transport system permease protein